MNTTPEQPEQNEVAALLENWRTALQKTLSSEALEKLDHPAPDYNGLAHPPLSFPTPGPQPLDVPQPGWDICVGLFARSPHLLEDIKTERDGGATCAQLAIESKTDIAALLPAIFGLSNGAFRLILSPGQHIKATAKAAFLRPLTNWDFYADPLGNSAVHAPETAHHFARTCADLYKDAQAAPAPPLYLLLADGAPTFEAGGNEVQELAAMAATFLAYVRALETADVPLNDAVSCIAIGLCADVEVFLTAAKIQAARAILRRIFDLCGIARDVALPPIHVQTGQRYMCCREAQNNVIRTSFAAAGALLGGITRLTVLPYNAPCSGLNAEQIKQAKTLARTTQLIMRDEAGLADFAALGAGSGYLSWLTEALAKNAWSLIQDIESMGGMAEAIASGRFQQRVQKTNDQRLDDLHTGRVLQIGVNAFTKPGDEDTAKMARKPIPPQKKRPFLSPIRLAQAFERR